MIKKIITKLLVTGFDLFPVHKQGENKKILIVFGGVIGDSVLFCDAIRGYKKLFPAMDGYEITIYAPSSAAFIFNKYVSGIQVVSVDFKKLNHDFGYHKEIVVHLQNKAFDLAIDPFPFHSVETTSLLLKCVAKRKIQVRSENSYKLKWTEKIFSDKIKEIIPVPDTLMELQKNAEVLRKLGLNDFKAELPRLEIGRNIVKQNICVLALGGSTPCKRWAGEKFAAIANYLVNNYNCKIMLCGGKGEEYIINEVMPHINNPISVESVVGKTSLSELVELIASARLLVGNDSSSVHIAAAVGTQAICIVGGWDYGRMYPYMVENSNKNDCLPVAVDHYMDCFGCAKKGIGFGNTVCQSSIRENMRYPCVDAVEVLSVIEKIKLFMDSDNKFGGNNEC